MAAYKARQGHLQNSYRQSVSITFKAHPVKAEAL